MRLSQIVRTWKARETPLHPGAILGRAWSRWFFDMAGLRA
jgi:hypothetical protein